MGTGSVVSNGGSGDRLNIGTISTRALRVRLSATMPCFIVVVNRAAIGPIRRTAIRGFNSG